MGVVEAAASVRRAVLGGFVSSSSDNFEHALVLSLAKLLGNLFINASRSLS